MGTFLKLVFIIQVFFLIICSRAGGFMSGVTRNSGNSPGDFFNRYQPGRLVMLMTGQAGMANINRLPGTMQARATCRIR